MSFFPPVMAFVVTCLVIVLILYSRLKQAIQDIPNERSLHSKAVPRTGGIGLLIGVFVGWSFIVSVLPWWLLVPLIFLFAISILDDIYSLPVKQRLLAHMGAAVVLLLGGGMFDTYGIVATVAIFFFVVWMTNLYNFMDGSDGLAGGMALFGFASYGIAAWMTQEYALASANFVIAAAALAFLLFNFHPAKIFMGDAGSIPLGFLAAAMGLWGVQLQCWAAWFPLLVFSPFIVDASVTLFKRALRGAKITEAHRDHYYQHAIQLGAGHRNVALFEYALMLMCGLLALWCKEQSFPWVMLLWCVSFYALCMYLLDARWHKKQREAA